MSSGSLQMLNQMILKYGIIFLAIASIPVFQCLPSSLSRSAFGRHDTSVDVKHKFAGSLQNVGRACESDKGDGICSPKCGYGTQDGAKNYYCGKFLKCCVIDYRPTTGMKCGRSAQHRFAWVKKGVCASFTNCKDKETKNTSLPLCVGGTHCCAKLPGLGDTCDRDKGRLGTCFANGSPDCKGITTRTCTKGNICCKLAADAAPKIEWNYIGPFGVKNWPRNFPNCNGIRQSPINIRSPQVMLMPEDVAFSGYDALPTEPFLIGNNGHTAQLSPQSLFDATITLGNGITYTFLQLHFHWGSNNEIGSEHLIDHEAFPLELHLVHVDFTSSDPLNDPDGLAVLGVLFELGEENENVQPIINSLKSIKFKDETADVEPFSLGTLLPSSRELYRYKGSLTTPPCSESVIWSVFQEPVTISYKQLKEFRTLIDNFGEKMVDNFRSPVPLFGRKVEFKSGDGLK